MPKVSILMNAYNAEKYLKAAIDSVYAQTYEDWEIIFIDNCSSDNTKTIVDNYDEKIKYYKTPKNIPLGAARNFGLQFCKSEYLAFLDTDDIWLEKKLEIQINLMEEYKDFILCYGGVEYINKDGESIGKMIPKATSGNVFVQQLRGYEINMQTVLLRCNNRITINEKLKHSPDFDLFMYLASRGQFLVIKEIIVKYRKLEDSLTSKNIEFWWSEMKYTLDRLYKDCHIRNQYKDYWNYGYAKVAYNNARYLISLGNRKEATMELSKYKYLNLKYFLIYCVSLLPRVFWECLHRKR